MKKTVNKNSVSDLRKKIIEAKKAGRGWTYGFLEVSIPDMKKHDYIHVGRNYMLTSGTIGVHEVAHPKYRDKNGNPIDAKQRKRNYEKAHGHIGCNLNGSALAKAQMSILLQSLGIRHRLYAGHVKLVDTWPDYPTDILEANNCSYSVS